ncbi:MAG: HRDC domain-containing protein [bacterium]|nr:HRDC domain-containing protein [bacterium]
MQQELPFFVNTPELLEESLRILANSSLIALDTELDSFYSYQDQICLVQISTPENDFIFDPLNLDITPLAPLFTEPERTVIFHAGMNDIPHLKHEFCFSFSNIFDTYIAAGLLNYPRRGLAYLLEKHFNIVLDKQYQRADWRQRPLSPEMLQYARYDTAYLFDLRKELLKELKNKNRLEAAAYAFKQTASTEFHAKTFDSTGWAKIKGIANIPRHRYGIVRELYIWREREAQRLNIQPFRVMPDYTILQLASFPPQSEKDLIESATVKHLETYPHQATGVYSAITAGKRIGAIPFPKPKRRDRIILSAAEQQRLHRLKEWRAQTVIKDEIASEFLLSNSEIFALAQFAPRSQEELQKSHILPPHILKNYGEAVIAVLNKAQ